VKRILLVEDDRASRAALREVLEDAGYEVVWAATAVAAIRSVAIEHPDLVLLDVLLGPDPLTGLDVARFMAADRRLRAIPVIVTSALTPEQIRARANANALEGLRAMTMEKPLDLPVLLAEIRAMLDSPKPAA
jgi:CheY-like chemotaxis protein